MRLKKEHANKIINIEHSSLIVVPIDEFSQGDALILFNNKDEPASIQCDLPNTYLSGRIEKYNNIDFPARCMMNAVFIDSQTVVFMKGVS